MPRWLRRSIVIGIAVIAIAAMANSEAITRDVQATHRLDRRRTYVAGHSAGAGLAQRLGATSPEVYAAAGFVSGATGPVPAGGRVPAYFVWGTDDRVTSYLTGRIQLLQWLQVPTAPRISLQPPAGPVPAFVLERYRRPCADVDFATGVGMGKRFASEKNHRRSPVAKSWPARPLLEFTITSVRPPASTTSGVL